MLFKPCVKEIIELFKKYGKAVRTHGSLNVFEDDIHQKVDAKPIVCYRLRDLGDARYMLCRYDFGWALREELFRGIKIIRTIYLMPSKTTVVRIHRWGRKVKTPETFLNYENDVEYKVKAVGGRVMAKLTKLLKECGYT